MGNFIQLVRNRNKRRGKYFASGAVLALDFMNGKYKVDTSYNTNILDVRGPELMGNGKADTDTTGWTGNGGVIQVVNKEFMVSPSVQYGGAQYIFPTKVGATYEVSMYVRTPGGNGVYLALNPSDSTTALGATVTNNNSYKKYTFTGVASTTLTRLKVSDGSAVSQPPFYIDNISIKEVSAVYTRTGTKSEIDVSGNLIEFNANEPGIVPGIGYWSRQSITNKCINNNANPINLTNVAKSGDAAATLTVVDDTAAIYAAGLQNICTSGKVYKLDNSAGTTTAYLNISGTTGNLNQHTIGAYARGGSGFIFLSGVGGIGFPSSDSYIYRNTTQTPTATSQSCQLATSAGQINYFILNQLVEGTNSGPIIITTGATATVTIDDMKLPSPITTDEDFAAWVIFNSKHADVDIRPLQIDDGTNNNRITFVRSAAANENATFVLANNVGIGIHGDANSNCTTGRMVFMIVRRAGVWLRATKNPQNVVTLAVGSTLTAFPTNLSRLTVGSGAGIFPPNSPIEEVYISKGTFSDEQIRSILENA